MLSKIGLTAVIAAGIALQFIATVSPLKLALLAFGIAL